MHLIGVYWIFFLQLQFVLLIVTSMRSGDLGLFVCLTGRISARWHMTPSPHPDGCFSVSLDRNKRRLLGHGVVGWAERSRGMRAQPGQPSGQLEGCATLLAADAPGRRSKAVLQHEAAAGPPSCHHRVTTHPSCWLNFSGRRDRADRLGRSGAAQSRGGMHPSAVALGFLPAEL